MSSNKKLHPSVQKFKAFVKRHPLLIQEVRNGQKSWQDIYEEWVILGEDNEHWHNYQKQKVKETIKVEEETTSSSTDTNANDASSSSMESLAGLMSMLKKVNIQDLQQHMSQFSGLLANVQSIMQAFQGSQQQGQQPPEQGQQAPQGGDPFSFRRH